MLLYGVCCVGGRKMVHLAEKERASRLAAKPLPPSQDIILVRIDATLH